jgi:hypothetical protein
MGSLVRLLAIFCSGLVILGFAYFATDELDRGSKTQQGKLDRELSGEVGDPTPIAPSPVQEAEREKLNGGFREAVPAMLALLLYGLGLGTLANMLPKQREHSADWRAPA